MLNFINFDSIFIYFFSYLNLFEDFLWEFVAFPILIILGIYLTYRSRCVQIRRFPSVIQRFWGYLWTQDKSREGVHPLLAFFACVGGCIGIGNLVAVCTAIQIGGPGALFWIWVTGFLGMLVKYSEVFLGMKYRVKRKSGYEGGPMYFLKNSFKTSWIPKFVCLLLCVYGVEIYQFRIVTESISHNFGVSSSVTTPILLMLVIYAGLGGVHRVGAIASCIIPIFVLLYCGMGLWILLLNYQMFPSVISQVFTSAFTGHAATGGFVGSTLLVALSQGVRRACYTGDLGVGYASVIHSESSVQIPQKQASLVIFDIFLDTFVVCSTSVLLILITGVWSESMDASLLVQSVLSQYFPYMHYFMPVFLFLLGYSTINAYFCVGVKSAEFLNPKRGKTYFLVYAISSFMLFSFFDPSKALTLMAISGGLLLVINGLGIFRLQKEVQFNF